MKTAAIRTLLLVVALVPTGLLDIVTALGQELINHIVSTRCGRHTCYGITHQYIGLLISSRVTMDRVTASWICRYFPHNAAGTRVTISFENWKEW